MQIHKWKKINCFSSESNSLADDSSKIVEQGANNEEAILSQKEGQCHLSDDLIEKPKGLIIMVNR